MVYRDLNKKLESALESEATVKKLSQQLILVCHFCFISRFISFGDCFKPVLFYSWRVSCQATRMTASS